MAAAASTSQISSSLTPINRINRLPIEIIGRIFIACARSHPHWLDRVSFPLKNRVICSLWDTISLSTPSLWTILSIGTDKPDNANVFLRRSGSLPLEVFLGPNALQQSHSFNCLLAIAPRIRTITLLHSNRDDIQFRNLVFPNLFELSTIVMRRYVDFESPPPRHTCFFLAAPSLRSLRLYGFNLEWKGFITSNLSKLRIYEADEWPTPVHIDNVAVALQSLPHLQELGLGGFRVLGLASADRNRRIAFNDLTSMRLDSFGSWAELNGIFSLVEAPWLKVLRLKVKSNALGSTAILEFDFPLIESLELVGSFGLSPQYISQNVCDKLQRLVLSRYRPFSNPVDLYLVLGSLGAQPSLRSLQTLQTQGIPLGQLCVLDQLLFPSLRKVLPHFRDVFLSAFNAKLEYEFRANEIRHLKDLAEEVEYWGGFENSGMPEPTQGDEEAFESWDVFREWLKAKTGWDKNATPPRALLERYFDSRPWDEEDGSDSEECSSSSEEDVFSDEDASDAGHSEGSSSDVEGEEDEEDELDDDGDVGTGPGRPKDDEADLAGDNDEADG